jgi:methylmalonyl-CoA mutase N-terminal domain/subunit
MGGAVTAIEKGYMQREIVESAYKHQKEVEAKERIIVGLNQFVAEQEPKITTLRVNPAVERKQVKQVQVLRRKRDKQKVQSVLNRLETAAEREENLMPIMIQAVKDHCTLGEVCGVLRQVYGDYRAPTIF